MQDLGFRATHLLHYHPTRSPQPYPIHRLKLVAELNDLTTQELIEEILTIRDKGHAGKIWEAWRRLEDKGMGTRMGFGTRLVDRIEECFDQLWSQRQDEDRKNQCEGKFVSSVSLLLQEIRAQISWSFMEKIWHAAKRISDLDLLLKYSQMIRIAPDGPKKEKQSASPAVKIFKELEICLKFVQSPSNENIPESFDFAILRSYLNFSEEEKLILRFFLVRLANILEQKKTDYSLQKRLQNDFKNFAKSNRSQRLLHAFYKKPDIVLGPFLQFTSQHSKILSVNLETKCLENKSEIFPNEMADLESIVTIYQESDSNLLNFITQKCVKVHEGAFFTVLDLKTIGKIIGLEEKWYERINGEKIYTLKSIVARLIQNSSSQLYQVTKDGPTKLPTQEFICRMFQIFAKCAYLSNQRSLSGHFQQILDEGLIERAFTFLVPLFKNETLKNEYYVKGVYRQMLSLLAFSAKTLEVTNPAAKQKQVERAMGIIKIYGVISHNWRTVKHVRFIIESYASIHVEMPEQDVKRAVDMLIDGLFSDDFEFTNSGYDFLKNPVPQNFYCEYFSQQILKKVQQFCQTLKENSNFHQDEDHLFKNNSFLFKLGTLVTGNFKLTTAPHIAKLLKGVYLTYAGKLKEMYRLRMWIIHYCPEIDSQEVTLQAFSVAQKIRKCQFLAQEITNLRQFYTKSANQMQEEQKQLFSAIESLQNKLDLKSQKFSFPKQLYHTLLLQILEPLSNWCSQLFIKTVHSLSQSPEQKKELSVLIANSYFRKNLSYYSVINRAMIKLRNTIRIYVCNIGTMVTVPQVREISGEIGRLAVLLASRKDDQRLNLIALLACFLSNFKQNFTSHLTIRQVICNSLAYHQRNQTLQNSPSPLMPLSKAIPMFSALKEVLPLLVVDLTNEDRKDQDEKTSASIEQLLKQMENDQELKIEKVIPNLMSAYGSKVLKKIFLPFILNEKTEGQKIGLSFYLEQMKCIFRSEICEDYIQDHTTRMLNVFKFRNSAGSSASQIKIKLKVEELLDFEDYQIEPMEYDKFKEEMSLTVKQFVDRLPSTFYRKKQQKIIHSFKNLLKLVEEIEKFGKDRQQVDKLTKNYVIVRLLKAGHEYFNQFYQQRSKNEQGKVKMMMSMEQNQMENENHQIGRNEEDESGSQSEEDKESIRKKIRQKLKNKKKRTDSSLYVLFNVLANVTMQNVQLVKECFKVGIQAELLKLFPNAIKEETYEIAEISEFVAETLPSFRKVADKAQQADVIKYYRLILTSIEALKLRNLDCVSMLCLRLVREAKNLQEIEERSFRSELLARIGKVLFKCMSYPFKMSEGKLLSIADAAIMENVAHTKSVIEFLLKNYIISEYEISKLPRKEEEGPKRIMKPDHMQLDIGKLKEKFNPYIIQYQKQFYETLRETIGGWKKNNHAVVYIKGISQISQFNKFGLNFAQYDPPLEIKNLLVELVQAFAELRVKGNRVVSETHTQLKSAKTNRDKKEIWKKSHPAIKQLTQSIDKHLKVLKGIIKSQQILIPFISRVLVVDAKGQQKQFLDFLIDVGIEEKIYSIYDLLSLFLNKNGLNISYEPQITFSQYTSSKVLVKIVHILRNKDSSKDLINNTVELGCRCLGIKTFNSMSNLPFSSDVADNFASGIEKLFNSLQSSAEQPMKLLYQECLFLMARHCQIEKLKDINGLKEMPLENQFINPELFLMERNSGSLKRRQRFSVFDLDSQQQDQDLKLVQCKAADEGKMNTTEDTTKSWKSLQDCIDNISKFLVGGQKRQPAQSSIQMQYQNIEPNQVDTNTLFQYYQKDEQVIRKAALKRKKVLRRFQNRKKVIKPYQIKAKQISQIYHLKQLNGKLRIMTPLTKYIKRKTKLSDSDLEDLADDETPTIRSQLQQVEDYQAEEKEANEVLSIANFIKFLENVQPNPAEFEQVQQKKTKKKENPIERFPLKKINHIEMKSQIDENDKNDDDDDDGEMPLPIALKRTDSRIKSTPLPEIQKILPKRKKEVKMEQQKIQERRGSIRQEQQNPELLKNEFYAKLAKMDYFERIQFLTNDANQQFIDSLPSEVSIEIFEEIRLLKSEKKRLQNQKEEQNQARNRQEFLRHRNIIRRKTKTQKKYHKPLSKEYQTGFSHETVINILKCLLIRVRNEKQEDQYSYCVFWGAVNMLLETSRDEIKYRVLKTLLLLVKNVDRVQMVQFVKQKWEQEKWAVSQSSLSQNQEGQKRFKQEILQLIKGSLQKCLFNNDDLILRKLDKKEYYDEILRGIQNPEKALDAKLGCDEKTYSPFNELLSLSLEHDQNFAGYLLSRNGDITEALALTIFKLMKSDKIQEDEFYNQLHLLSQNTYMVKLFRENFTLQDPPSFELLGKVLKYAFGRVPYAKKLHLKALRQYRRSYNEFLDQIFLLYSPAEIIENEYQLKQHKKVLDGMVRDLYKEGVNIKEKPIFKIVCAPGLLDFASKQKIFRSDLIFQSISIFSETYSGSNELIIDPQNAFSSVYNQIMRLEPTELRKNFDVKFTKSNATGGGLLKSLIDFLYKEMFENETGMFIPIGNSIVYQPSKFALFSNPDYLNCYKFFGRLLGICITHEQVFPAFFTKTFYRMLLGKKSDWRELKQFNERYYEIIQSLDNCRKKNPEQEIADFRELWFTYEGKEMTGQQIEYELKENGKNIQVCNNNFEEYVELMTKALTLDFCSKQYEKILEGFNEVIPLEKLLIFSEGDLEMLISGCPDLDPKEFRKHCKLDGFTEGDKEIQWFWKYVDNCGKQKLTNLVRHFNGMGHLPPGGFADVNVQILKLPLTDVYPVASLCFGIQIKMPSYTTEEIFVKRMEQAIQLGKIGDGFVEGG